MATKLQACIIKWFRHFTTTFEAVSTKLLNILGIYKFIQPVNGFIRVYIIFCWNVERIFMWKAFFRCRIPKEPKNRLEWWGDVEIKEEVKCRWRMGSNLMRKGCQTGSTVIILKQPLMTSQNFLQFRFPPFNREMNLDDFMPGTINIAWKTEHSIPLWSNTLDSMSSRHNSWSLLSIK